MLNFVISHRERRRRCAEKTEEDEVLRSLTKKLARSLSLLLSLSRCAHTCHDSASEDCTYVLRAILFKRYE